MKKLWVNVVPYNKEIAIAALESGAEAVCRTMRLRQKPEDTAR